MIFTYKVATGAEEVQKKGAERPDWTLMAKVTQHMETILLREKFLDWPDFSRVIQVKTQHKAKQVSLKIVVIHGVLLHKIIINMRFVKA